MTNYNDCTQWVEVPDRENEFYLQEHEEYNPDYLLGLFKGLINQAEAKGLEGCYLRFESHMEPYEDYTSNPSVCVVGYRRLSTAEKEEIQEDYRVKRLAEELGITPYEARIVQDLKKRGKI